MTEESIMQLVRSRDADDLLPDNETDRTEAAINDLHRASLEGKYSFINVIVLSVVLLACAVYFISMTSGDRYSDREIEISPKRLVDGSFTAELSRRYYSTVAYPEEIDKLYERLTSFYGITGEGKKASEQLRHEFEITPPNDHSRPTTTKKPHTENEVTTTSATEDNAATTTAITDPTDNSTVFSRTTTVSTTLDFDPLNPYYTTSAEETTTTNNTAPPASATTTEAPNVTVPTQTCQTEPPPPPPEEPPDESSSDSSPDSSESETPDTSENEETSP